MQVLVQDTDLERAEEGKTELVLVAVTYTGPRASLATPALNSQGKWPGMTPLVGGITYVALVPDEGLGFLESRGDLEVR